MGYNITAQPISPSQILAESVTAGGIALKHVSADHCKAIINSLRNGTKISEQEAQNRILLPQWQGLGYHWVTSELEDEKGEEAAERRN